MTGGDDPPKHGDGAHAEAPNTSDIGASPAPREYTVGYRRPPRSTRFKSGTSGNPKGRRKGVPSVSEQIKALLLQKVAVTEGGKRKLLSLQEVMFKSIAKKAVGGDLKAVAFLLDLVTSHKDSASSSIDPKMLDDEAQAVLADFVRQLQTGEMLEGADHDLANCVSGEGNELDKEMRRDGSVSADVPVGNPDSYSPGASKTDIPLVARGEAQVPYPTPSLSDTPVGVKSNSSAADHSVSEPASPLAVPNPSAQINADQEPAENNSAPRRAEATVTREAVPLATACPERWRRS